MAALLAAFAAGAPAPSIELAAGSSRLLVTEETVVQVRLWLPPLEGDLADTPPFIAQRPPHLQAPFWLPSWKSDALAPTDPKRMPPVVFDGDRRRGAPVYTLNEYVTDSIFSAFGGRDPFAGLFDDDFGPSIGPRAQTFPFTVGRERRGGVNGWLFVAESLPYRAVAPGRVRFEPVSARLPVITSVRITRDRFGRAVYSPTVKDVSLRTKELVVEVSEPPLAGRPRSYCGAISSNLVVKASLDANVCTAGDPLVFSIDISGATDQAGVYAPSFAEEVGKDGVFRLDEASLRTETLAQSRRFSWRVRALKAGTVEFPSLSVSCYDPAGRAYRTLRTESIPVQVKAGVQAAIGEIEGAGGMDADYPMPDGIDLDPAGAAALPLLPRLPLSIALFVLAPVAFLLVRLAPAARRSLSSGISATRRASAYMAFRRSLAGSDDARRAEAVRALLESRYGVKGAAVTEADARRLMAGDFSEEEVEAAAAALAEADRTSFSMKRTLTTLAVLAFAGLAASGAGASQVDFTYRRAGALATRASDEAGFMAAAKAYSECAADGASNPTLFCNLGACALMGGDARWALDAFARAERRGGETPTTRRGVRAALARLKGDPRADLPLTRTFFAPHVMLSLDARLLLAALAWTLAWFAALLPPGGARRSLLAALAAAFIALTASVSVSIAGEQMAKGASHEVR